MRVKGAQRHTRRSFLKNATGLSVAALGARPHSVDGSRRAAPESGVPQGQTAASKKFVAIQVGAVSFVDEGVDKVLDIFQEKARINALLLAVFTYGRGIAGRQIPGQPLPDHGTQEYDTKTFHGGCYSAVHPEYYKGAAFTDFRAPDLGDFDLLASVVPRAKARGIRSYCWFEDVYNPRLLPNFEKVAEIDVYGRRTGHACLNN